MALRCAPPHRDRLRRAWRVPRRLGRLGVAGGGTYGAGVLSDVGISPHINGRPAELVGVTLLILWLVATSIAMLRRAAP